MCKWSGESIDNCYSITPVLVMYGQWCFACLGQLGVCLSVSWHCWSVEGGFGQHLNVDIWGAIPFCVMWIIWGELNNHMFEGMEIVIISCYV